MTVARVAAWDANNFNEPQGTIPPEAGSNRLLVVMQITELEGGFTTSVFTIGTVAFTAHFRFFSSLDNVDQQIDYYVWDEAAIASMSGSSVSYTDDATHTGTMFTYATFTGANQSTPAAAFTAQNNSADTLDVTTTSVSGDFIVCASSRSASGRDITDWDTLTEIFDTGASGYRQSMAEGNGGDNTTTVVGDGTSNDMTLHALVINQILAAGENTIIIVPTGPALS